VTIASPHTNLDLTSVLAIWGAILSSITFGWNLFRDLRDRPRIKLKGTLGQLVTDTVGRLHFANMKFIERHTDNDPRLVAVPGWTEAPLGSGATLGPP
jgi:hypothetical protein